MSLWRLLLRAPALLAMSLTLILIRLLVWPAALVSEPVDRRHSRALLQLWTRLFARLGGIRVRSTGTPPRRPFFLVANHLTYLDMLALCHVTGCLFVSREDVQHWPVIGVVARSLRIIFVDRASRRDTVRVNALISRAMEMGEGVVVFPESHTSRGVDVDPFKTALIEPACAAGVPVHYATLNYETDPGCPPPGVVVLWWRPESFFYHLQRLLRLKGVTIHVHFGEEPLYDPDRKVLAPLLRDAVRAQFRPLEGAPEAPAPAPSEQPQEA